MAAEDWLAALADCRELSDLDEVRELGEWMTGGGCTAFGVEFDHGGDPYRVMVTDEYRDATAPDDATTLVAVGVYAEDADYDPDQRWCLAETVPLAELPGVIAALLELVHDRTCPLTDWSVYPPDQWRRMIAGRTVGHA
jgi:hypothetical protein